MKKFKQIFTHPFLGTTFLIYCKLLITNGLSFKRKVLFKIVYLFFSSILMGVLAGFERVFFFFKNSKEEDPAPVFIIGHWRSGTTFLHYMMTKDRQFGYIDNRLSFMPHTMQIGKKLIAWLVKIHLMPKRPMDDVKMTVNSPQEEEFALSNYGMGAYLGWFFPKKMKAYFSKYVFMENMTLDERTDFEKCYQKIIAKANYINEGKQLILKNPANTARVKMLLKLFPNAKFIYLHRNREEVYWSSLRLHEKLIESFALQPYDKKTIEEFVPPFYKKLMRQYEQDKKEIPIGNLVEIDYQKLILEPMDVLEDIYQSFDFQGFKEAKSAFEKFILDQKKYQPANYKISKTVQKQVEKLMKVA